MGKTIEEGCSMIKIIEGILGEKILGCRIREVRILEVVIEIMLGMITLEEVEISLEKDNIQVVIEGVSKVVVGLDQVQE